MQSKFRRSNPSRRLTIAFMILGLALGLPAFAGDPPAAPDVDATEPVAVKVGNASIRWHFAAEPRAAVKSPLIERYQQLVAARFTGDEVSAAVKAVIEPAAGGTSSSGSFSSHGMVRVPAEQFHTMFIGGDGTSAVCAKGGPSAKSAAAGEGEGR